MQHPASCKDPQNCGFSSYVEHLRTIKISPAATPSRNLINRTPGQPDEPLEATRERQVRWDREGAAFKQLRESGVRAPSLAEAPALLKDLGG